MAQTPGLKRLRGHATADTSVYDGSVEGLGYPPPQEETGQNVPEHTRSSQLTCRHAQAQAGDRIIQAQTKIYYGAKCVVIHMVELKGIIKVKILSEKKEVKLMRASH